jgi:hypothetical protein
MLKRLYTYDQQHPLVITGFILPIIIIILCVAYNY